MCIYRLSKFQTAIRIQTAGTGKMENTPSPAPKKSNYLVLVIQNYISI